MSELNNVNMSARNARRHLLATVSSLSLMLSVSAMQGALASNDADRPTVWIELGGQLSRVGGDEDPYLPSFTPKLLSAGLGSPDHIQRAPGYSIGGEGKLVFSPQGTDWVFSAGVKYGKANSDHRVHQSLALTASGGGLVRTFYRYEDAKSHYNESHAILDFQVGKDVGLGTLGRGGNSLLSLGVRFAQFNTRSRANFAADPDYAFVSKYLTFVGDTVPLYGKNHSYRGTLEDTRSFRGVGPSVDWDASAPIFSVGSDSAVTLDWGVNGAVLFGRQKAEVHQNTIGYYIKRAFAGTVFTTPTRVNRPYNRSRSVVVPNVGGFAGVSYKFPNAKLSLGYRADFFFGAMDMGQAARNSRDRNFYGPFAKISIGLGG